MGVGIKLREFDLNGCPTSTHDLAHGRRSFESGLGLNTGVLNALVVRLLGGTLALA